MEKEKLFFSCWMYVREKKSVEETAGVSQKDHLSCVRGSVESEGDSEGWLLLSSPFKLIRHTGHVSCISSHGTIQSE